MGLNLWFKMTQTTLVIDSLAQHIHIAMSWSCIILCIALIVFLLCCRYLSRLGRRCSGVVIVDTNEDSILSSEVPGKQKPLVHSDTTHSLAPALFYCIRTTTIHLLLVAVVEPLILYMTCHCHSKLMKPTRVHKIGHLPLTPPLGSYIDLGLPLAQNHILSMNL